MEEKVTTAGLDELIEERELRIQRIFFVPELDLLLVLLNDRNVLKCPLSQHPKLFEATPEQREAYRITPRGVHWDKLDEDLSLKGLMEADLMERFASPKG